jgi:GTP-binding protein HflX
VLDEQMAEVDRVLQEIGAGDVPQLLVYNKQDLLPDDQRPRVAVDAILRGGAARPTPRVFVSAVDGTSLAELRDLIAQAVQAAQLDQPVEASFDERFDERDGDHLNDGPAPSSADDDAAPTH